MKWFLSFLLLTASICLYGQVQSDTTLFRIETFDGNEFIGSIVSQDAEMITLKTEQLGIIQIKKKNVKNMAPVINKQMKDGVYWFENPQSTRYFWQPNGYGLKSGEGYYQNVWIFFNQVSFGITDHFLIGAGLVPTFLFGADVIPVWLTPKFSIPVVKDNFNLGVGALLGTVLGTEESGYGILYGTGTLGSRDKNISLGLGYGYASGELTNAPVITLSGMLRTGQRGYLLMENYFVSTSESTDVILFIGGRRLIKRSGLDFGLLIPPGIEGTFVAIPWLGLTIPFGKY